MKYTTTILAGLAAGAAADSWDPWSSSSTSAKTTTSSASKKAATTSSASSDFIWGQWSSGTTSSSATTSSSSKKDPATTSVAKSSTTAPVYCPSVVTSTATTTATVAEVTSEVYATTVYVEAPETKTVTVYADGKTAAQGAWEEWAVVTSSKPADPTSIPAGCIPAVTTKTKTEYVMKTGSTTTITGSTLFVGAGKGAKTTVTVTATGSAAAWGSGAGAGAGASSATTTASGKAGGVAGNDGGVAGNDGGAGAATTAKIIASGGDAFSWTVTQSAPVKTVSKAPEYSQLPDGSWGVIGDGWDDWQPGNGDGSNDGNSGNGGNGGKNGTDSGNNGGNNGGNGGGKNGTIPGTFPEPGTAASNVTKPFEPLEDTYCNHAADRSVWCHGKSISTDYYQDYFSGRRCTFDFTLTNTTANFDGTEVPVLAVNGQVPGPAVECNWGDIVVINVHNQLQHNGTSIHWHGIRQVGTNDQDGVPGVTECPLAPGESRTYTWHASSYGTSWYHSHWASQYGDGVHGPIIIHGPATANYDIDAGIVDISDTFPVTASGWNHIIAHSGPKGTTNYLLNGHNTKADLTGGQHTLWKVQKGKKYLFRLLNSAAQNMFSVSIDNHKMKVIAADFVPIVPYETEWLNIGIGQRYDVVVEMDQAVDSYFLRAVTQTECPSTCDNTGLGQANGIIAYEGVSESPFLLPTSTVTGNKTIADFNICEDEPLASLVPYLKKSGGTKTGFRAEVSTLPAGAVNLIQTADGSRVFRWFINNGFIDMNYTQPTLRTLAEHGNSSLISNPIILNQKNEWVYFVIQNQFFAAHPMHLHGHDFSVLGQGSAIFDDSLVDTLNFDNPMRRDTAMLMGQPGPGVGAPGYTVIGFETDNPGAWLMHCHIVWHVDGGLSLQWIERPDDIKAEEYYNAEFADRCESYTTYDNGDTAYHRFQGESGLKKRTFFDEQVSKINGFQFDEVVRRSGQSEKRYLDHHAMKRGIGQSRHFRR